MHMLDNLSFSTVELGPNLLPNVCGVIQINFFAKIQFHVYFLEQSLYINEGIK